MTRTELTEIIRKEVEKSVRKILREEIAYGRSLTETFVPQREPVYMPQPYQPLINEQQPMFNYTPPAQTRQAPRPQQFPQQTSTSPFASLMQEVAGNISDVERAGMSIPAHLRD